MKRRNTFRAALALLLILNLCMPAAASGFTGKLIAITFDDGPGAYTAQLLDELAARDVKATFFVSGYRAANYPETLKRMVSEGHQLASHTQNHENLNTLSAAKIADTIDWSKVKNIKMLTLVSQVYEKMKNYTEAKNVLLLAYERVPVGRRMLYKLTELCIKAGNLDEAEEFFE